MNTLSLPISNAALLMNLELADRALNAEQQLQAEQQTQVQLQQQLQQQQQTLNDAQGEISRLKAALKQLAQQNPERLKKQLKSKQQQLDEKKAACARFKASNTQLKAENSSLRRRNRELDQTLDLVSEEINAGSELDVIWQDGDWQLVGHQQLPEERIYIHCKQSDSTQCFSLNDGVLTGPAQLPESLINKAGQLILKYRETKQRLAEIAA